MARRNRSKKSGSSKKAAGKRALRDVARARVAGAVAEHEGAGAGEARLDDLIARLRDFEARFARWENDLSQFRDSLGPTEP